jgi:hypothetical protein
VSEPLGSEPRRGLRGDRVAGIAFVLIALVVAWQNRAYPLGALHDPGPGYVPLLLAILLGLFGAAIALRGGASPLISSIEWSEGKRGMVVLFACAAATFALEHIGYRLTMVALLAFILGVVERKRALPTTLVAVGFAGVSYFLFADVLKVQLPRGPWGL